MIVLSQQNAKNIDHSSVEMIKLSKKVLKSKEHMPCNTQQTSLVTKIKAIENGNSQGNFKELISQC